MPWSKIDKKNFALHIQKHYAMRPITSLCIYGKILTFFVLKMQFQQKICDNLYDKIM